MCKRKFIKGRQGLTLVEVIIAAVIASVVILSLSVLLFDGQKGWHKTYGSVHGDVVAEGYVARKTFDKLVRQASGKSFRPRSLSAMAMSVLISQLQLLSLSRSFVYFTFDLFEFLWGIEGFQDPRIFDGQNYSVFLVEMSYSI